MFQNLRIHSILIYCTVCIVLCATVNFTAAQINLSVTAGAGKTSLYKFPFSTTDFDKYSAVTSWRAGLSSELPITENGITILASSCFNIKGYQFLLQNQTGSSNTLKDSGFKQQLNYIDLNLSLQKKFKYGDNNSFFAGAGPVINYFIGGKENIDVIYFGSTKPAVNSSNSNLATGTGPGKYKQLFFNWGFNAGFQFNNFSVSFHAAIPIDYYYEDVQNAVKHKLKYFGLNTSYTFYTYRKKEKRVKIKKEKTVEVKIDTLKDADNDGITDNNDKCPDKVGSQKYFGCPVPDTDGDGVNDEIDKCITVKGTIDNNGCPAKPDSVIIKTNDTTCLTVYFEPGKSILRSEGFKTLTEVVNMLKKNNKLVAEFRGHTDNVGSEAANYSRSMARASVCADYVASFYIDKERLTIISLGNKMPAADLKDPLLQWKNRRVEICVYEKK